MIPTFKKEATFGEVYDPAMQVKTEEEAADYLLGIVYSIMVEHGKTSTEALELAKNNLGYYAGYYDDETRERVERLFGCAHPIFGPIAKGKPTPEQAFKMGQELMENYQQRKEHE